MIALPLLLSCLMFFVIFGGSIAFIVKIVKDQEKVRGLYNSKDVMKDVKVNGESQVKTENTTSSDASKTMKMKRAKKVTCIYCDSEIDPESNFCPHCGAKVEKEN